MTIDEAKIRRDMFELDISCLINKFESDTGLHVNDITVYRIEDIVGIKTTIELKQVKSCKSSY